jgi:hypothetical protein
MWLAERPMMSHRTEPMHRISVVAMASLVRQRGSLGKAGRLAGQGLARSGVID